jgi:hypothetical protein
MRIPCKDCWKEIKMWPNKEDMLCFKCAFVESKASGKEIEFLETLTK